jgi:hypothetical protein
MASQFSKNVPQGSQVTFTGNTATPKQETVLRTQEDDRVFVRLSAASPYRKVSPAELARIAAKATGNTVQIGAVRHVRSGIAISAASAKYAPALKERAEPIGAAYGAVRAEVSDGLLVGAWTTH